MQKNLKNWTIVMGCLILLLGLVHCYYAIPLYEWFPQQDRLTHLYMFLGTGFAVIFTGLLILLAVAGFGTGHPLGWRILVLCGKFIIILGAGAIITMPDNIFSYLLPGIGLLELVPLLIFKDTVIKPG